MEVASVDLSRLEVHERTFVSKVYAWMSFALILTCVGSLCYMGLIGVVLASVVNMFLGSPGIYWAVTYIGVLVFVGLTAYDTQKIKAYGKQAIMGSEQAQKMALLGALALYLDFINLFLLLLRLFGRRR